MKTQPINAKPAEAGLMVLFNRHRPVEVRCVVTPSRRDCFVGRNSGPYRAGDLKLESKVKISSVVTLILTDSSPKVTGKFTHRYSMEFAE